MFEVVESGSLHEWDERVQEVEFVRRVLQCEHHSVAEQTGEGARVRSHIVHQHEFVCKMLQICGVDGGVEALAHGLQLSRQQSVVGDGLEQRLQVLEQIVELLLLRRHELGVGGFRLANGLLIAGQKLAGQLAMTNNGQLALRRNRVEIERAHLHTNRKEPAAQ